MNITKIYIWNLEIDFEITTVMQQPWWEHKKCIFTEYLFEIVSE